MALTENESHAVGARPRVMLAVWALGVLALWCVAHALNRWVLLMDASTQGPRFVYWTGSKLVAWLLPTFILLRRCGRASVGWLGLTTSNGLGIALLWSLLWIGLQETGGWLHLPLFGRPPADLTGYSLSVSLLIAPCFEEVMFRGAMLRMLKEAGHARVVSVVICAIAFALLHVPGWIFRRGLDLSIVGAFLSIWAFGVVAGFLAWRVPTLWGPIFLHWANNFWSTGALAWSLEYIVS